MRAARGDRLLLALLAVTVVAVLPAVGALLVTTLLVVPAATARLLTDVARARCSPRRSALAAAEGAGGLLLAYHLDLPPGPAIAVHRRRRVRARGAGGRRAAAARRDGAASP